MVLSEAMCMFMYIFLFRKFLPCGGICCAVVSLTATTRLQPANFADLNANFLSLQNLSVACSTEWRVHTFFKHVCNFNKKNNFCGLIIYYYSCRFVRRLLFILNVPVMQHSHSDNLQRLLMWNSVHSLFFWTVKQNTWHLKFHMCTQFFFFTRKRDA
jgi:hypothetical protein